LRGPRASRKPAWGKLIGIALACAALAAAWRYTPLSDLVTPERITTWARAVRGTWWAPIVVVLISIPRPRSFCFRGRCSRF